MKSLITSTLLLLFYSTICQVTWEPFPGIPGGSDVQALSVGPDGKWYINGQQFIYSSDDAGQSWVCETENGGLPNIRRMKYLEDGTPIWGDQNKMIIKRDGVWERQSYSNDFETLKDTIYGVKGGNVVQKSWDKGLTWHVHLFIHGTNIYRYRTHNNRHYIEYSDTPNRKFGEVTLAGEIVSWTFAEPSDFQAFIIDDCNNAHRFYGGFQKTIFSDGSKGEHSFSGNNGKIFHYGNRIIRKQGNTILGNLACGTDWEEVGNFTGIEDFFPIGPDTLLLVYKNEKITKVKLPNEEISSQFVFNIDQNTWFHQEMPDGTKYESSNTGDYRVNPDGSIDVMDFDLQLTDFGPTGWLYRNVDQGGILNSDSFYLSRDRGDTWDTLPMPGTLSFFLDFYPLAEDIIAFSEFEGTTISLDNGNALYTLSANPGGFNHFYNDFTIREGKIIMKGNNPQVISTFDLTTKAFDTLVYVPDWNMNWSFLDDEATLFGLTDDETILRIVPYPYTEEQSIILPEGDFRNISSAGNGCLVLNRYALFHIDKDLVVSGIPLGPMVDVQLNAVSLAHSKRWIVETFGKVNAFITSSFDPAGELGTLVSGNIAGANVNCEFIGPISASNWKVQLSNAEHKNIAYGQATGKYAMRVQPGDYTFTIRPPSYSTWTECFWPVEITVIENEPQEDVTIGAHLVETCDAGIISLSASFIRRCFESKMYIDVNNSGQQALVNPQVLLSLHNNLVITASNYGHTVDNMDYIFDLPDIPQGESLKIVLTVLAPCSFELGQNVCSQARLMVSDTCSEINYKDALCRPVIGSWDPNDKNVTDEDGSSISYFKRGDFLHFKIRFQNTGTDTAFHVRIADQLHPMLDLLTLEVVSSSHDHSFQVDEDRNLQIFFKDINLPDSARNEVESHGHYEFRIKAVSEIAIGDTLTNKADIFFDFNEGIRTNTVVAQLDPSTSVQFSEFKETGLILMPNPAAGFIRIHYKSEEQTGEVAIYNAFGERLFHKPKYIYGDAISIGNLFEGIYFAVVNSGVRQQTLKFVKM